MRSLEATNLIQDIKNVIGDVMNVATNSLFETDERMNGEADGVFPNNQKIKLKNELSQIDKYQQKALQEMVNLSSSSNGFIVWLKNSTLSTNEITNSIFNINPEPFDP
jgi:hypothetical protein